MEFLECKFLSYFKDRTQTRFFVTQTLYSKIEYD